MIRVFDAQIPIARGGSDAARVAVCGENGRVSGALSRVRSACLRNTRSYEARDKKPSFPALHLILNGIVLFSEEAFG